MESPEKINNEKIKKNQQGQLRKKDLKEEEFKRLAELLRIFVKHGVELPSQLFEN